MKCAIFETVLDAAIYRKNHGGWLFVADNHGTGAQLSQECCWFDAACYTPSSIMFHRLTKGQSGNIVCDNRYAP